MDSNCGFYECLKEPLSKIKEDTRFKNISKSTRYRNKTKARNRKVELCARIFDHVNESEISCMLLSNAQMHKDSNYLEISKGTIVKEPNITKSKAKKNDVCKYIHNEQTKKFFYRQKNIGDRWIFETALANIAFNRAPSKEVIPNDTIVENESVCVKVFYIDKNVKKNTYFTVFLDMFYQENITKNLCKGVKVMIDYCRDNLNDKTKDHFLVLKFTKRQRAKVPEVTVIASSSIKQNGANVHIDDVCTSEITNDVRELLSQIDVVSQEFPDNPNKLKNLPFASLMIHIAFKWQKQFYPEKKIYLNSTRDGLMTYLRNGFLPIPILKNNEQIKFLEETVINNEDRNTRSENLENWLTNNGSKNEKFITDRLIDLIKMKISPEKVASKITQQNNEKQFKFLKLNPRAFVPNNVLIQ